jgi:hypothetical protein
VLARLGLLPRPRQLTRRAFIPWGALSTDRIPNLGAGADKFGNVFCLRLPAEVSEDMEDDPTGSAVKWDVSRTGSAAHKVDCASVYHVGETVHSLTKATLQPGGLEALVYSTLLGGLGAMVPFSSKDDVEFFQQLEMHMRQEVPPPGANTHAAHTRTLARAHTHTPRTLEQHELQSCCVQNPPLTGRDHLAFRSYYVPVKARKPQSTQRRPIESA